MGRMFYGTDSSRMIFRPDTKKPGFRPGFFVHINAENNQLTTTPMQSRSTLRAWIGQETAKV